jgi:dTMP kinase
MARGTFIAIEGGEGSGKSSQLDRLKEKCPDAVHTREPGGSPYAEEIRNVILKSEYAGEADAKTMLALLWAARADHMRATVIPALKAGHDVVSDRSDASTYAYQVYGLHGRQLEELFFTMRDHFLEDWKPDVYIYFDVSTEEGLRRRGNAGGTNHFDERDASFHNEIRRGYEAFFERIPHERVNADQDIDTVFNSFYEIIDRYLF